MSVSIYIYIYIYTHTLKTSQMTREPIRTKSIHIPKLYHILFYYLKKLLCQLYYTILQYSQYPSFYFTIQHIKIIFLYNNIIYPKTQKLGKKERGIDKVSE